MNLRCLFRITSDSSYVAPVIMLIVSVMLMMLMMPMLMVVLMVVLRCFRKFGLPKSQLGDMESRIHTFIAKITTFFARTSCLSSNTKIRPSHLPQILIFGLHQIRTASRDRQTNPALSMPHHPIIGSTKSRHALGIASGARDL